GLLNKSQSVNAEATVTRLLKYTSLGYDSSLATSTHRVLELSLHHHTPIVSSRPSSVPQGVQGHVVIVARLELIHVHHLACSTRTFDPEVQWVIRSFG